MVCSSTPEEAGVIAKLRPDAVIVEPPHLIGTLKSVGREREFVIRSIKVVKDIDPKIALICGAGISSGKDVMELIRLGVDGTGASRSICESKEPYKLLIEITRAMEDEWQSKIVRA
jgi:triosephosphate isomerase